MGTIYSHNEFTISLLKQGADRYTKSSYPQRFGRYSEIDTAKAIYQFNLNGEITFAKGKRDNWLDPQEWLKRSAGNDWIYYSTGGYSGVFAAIGEYYLPNMQYQTNSLIGGKPFASDHVRRIVDGWHEHIMEMRKELNGAPADILEFIDRVAEKSPAVLAEKARRLFNICGGRTSVLPPDSRHVDYDIIPLTISSGCLYKCRFCKVKNNTPFREMDKEEIGFQLKELAELYGESISNYNSIFLGEHDALCCSRKLLLYSVEQAYESLGFASSYMQGANVFLFGSVDSFLAAETLLFDELSKLPCEFYINIGLESADQQTLDYLGKPISSTRVKEAFWRIQEINDRYLNIEITANFLMDASLPENHHSSLLKLVRDSLPRRKPKGTIYLSPLRFDAPSRELVYDFNQLKLQSRLPTFLYIIQRL